MEDLGLTTKASMAFLIAGIAYVGSGLLANGLVKPKEYEHLAIALPGPAAATAVVASAVVPEPPVALLLASADVGRGEGTFKQQGCVACHSVNEGGKNGVGPNLYGVLGGPKAAHEGYTYSSALKAKGGNWGYDELTSWLLKPAAYAPGTKMSYAGLADAAKRADVILYLRSLNATPVALPEVPAQTAAVAKPPSVAVPASAVAGAPMPAGAAAVAPIAARLVSADAGAGQASTSKLGCVACHSFNEAGKNGVGPNLYGVVGQPIAAHAAGYAYSSALKAKSGAQWNYEELDKWLLKPAAYAPGTKMSYAGISDPQQRANVIAYLRTLSGTPEPLPTP